MHLLKRFNSQLLFNTSWMLLSEGASRASRLLTIIALAAYLAPAQYGTAMLAIAVHEIFRVLMRAGAGPKIIQCADAELGEIAGNGASLQWIIYLVLAAVQWGGAELVGYFYHNELLTELLQLMALSYLFYPLVSVRVFLLQRENKMRYVSLAGALCVIVENVGCAILLFLQAGVMAVVYAKIAAAAVWALAFYWAPVARIQMQFIPHVILTLSKYSGRILAVETMRVLRTQYDMLIAGYLLAPELLGIYSFAKSAGVGLGQSISAAYISVLFPHICKQQRMLADNFRHGAIFLLSSLIGLLFVAQALVAPFYITWLFADHWHTSANIVSLLCLSAIPALIVDTESSFLRAQGRLGAEFLLGVFCVLVSVIGLHLFNPQSPIEFAQIVAISSLFWMFSLGHRFVYLLPFGFKRVCL